MEKGLFRQVMGRYATGVTVVTTSLDGKNYGFTVNSFTSVSLHPPLVLICVNSTSETCRVLQESKHFAVNVLTSNQEDLSNLFANPNIRAGERFKNIDFSTSSSGSPILPDVLAWIDCSLHEVVDGGDHLIFIGRVTDMAAETEDSESPLLYYSGTYKRF